MAVLRVVKGEDSGKIYSVTADKLVMGRDSDELPILDQGVSRQHAEIARVGELYFIRDLESRNGTFLNQTRVDEQEVLRNGDRIQVGNTILSFEDAYARMSDSRMIKFGNSIETPGSTISLQLPADEEGRLSGQPSRLQTLYRISRILGTVEEASSVFENVVKEMSGCLNADHVYLFACANEFEEDFDLVAAYDRTPANEIAVSRSILQRVTEEGRPILCSDAMLDDRFASSQSVVMKQLKSILCVPLLVTNKPVGAFYATNTKISEAFSPEDLELATTIGMLVGNAMEMWEVVEHQGHFYRDVLKIISTVAEVREAADLGQSERVATYAAAMARALGMTSEETRNIWIGGLLHDIGAIALREEEIANTVNLEQRKAKLAATILEKVPALQTVAPMILQHTERVDGSGFPEGLEGKAIPKASQVIGLACEFEGLLSGGGEDGAELTAKEALIRARDLAGTKFSVEVVNSLLIAYRRGILFREDKQIFKLGI